MRAHVTATEDETHSDNGAMSETLTLDGTPALTARSRNISILAFVAAATWALAAYAAAGFEDVGDWLETQNYAIGAAVVASLIFLLSVLSGFVPGVSRWAQRSSPWLIVLGLFFTLWQVAAAKAGWVPQPFFPPPQALVEVFSYEYAEIWGHVISSLKLVVVGFVVGTSVGFIIGVAVGWSTHVAYWVHPVLRFIGPLPATALLPVVFFIFPTSYGASIFLIALASGFPVAVLTWSGVAGVDSAYYDVARTLGVKPLGLILKVAIPAALPSVFVGLFMSLGAAFSALMVAELIGVKAGMAFYIQWSQGWASYANVWSAIIVLAILCSGSITILFKIRDRLLAWQKGLVKW